MTEVKENFSSMYQDLNCNLCNDDVIQSDNHLLQCSKIIEECSELIRNNVLAHKQIFSNDVNKQLSITKLYSKVFKTKTLLEQE